MRWNRFSARDSGTISRRDRLRLTCKSVVAVSTLCVASYRSVWFSEIVWTGCITPLQSKILAEVWRNQEEVRRNQKEQQAVRWI